MLANDLLCALDPVHFAASRLGIILDPWQCDLVRSRGLRECVNVARQCGKSTSTAVAALHEAEYVPGSKTIIVSPSLRQSSLLLTKIAEYADVAELHSRPAAGEDTGLRFNGGEVIALPGAEATTRGFSACTWLVIDEAARVPDALYYSARAFLATSNGRAWLLSTPFGRRGFFHAQHESGRWRVTRVAAGSVPRISAGFLEEMKLELPDAWFRQEYCCEFTSTDEGVFDHDLVISSLSSEVEELCL
jgi:hypothetical protein